MPTIPLRLIFAFAAGSSPVFGQLVVYNFGTSGTPVDNATTCSVHLSASSFSSLTGSGDSTSSSPGSSSSGGSGGGYFTANTFRSTDGNYFQFTVTPAAGYQVTLSNLSFYYLSTSSGPTTSTVVSSKNNYSSNLASITLTRATSTPAASDWHLSSNSITLTFTAPTTFRINGSGATSLSGSFKIDDVTLTGSVAAIPEPSTYAAIFGALALAGAAWQRKLRR